MVLSCDELTDDELVAKLRSCFHYAPTMIEAREELQNMKQLEHESVSVYMCSIQAVFLHFLLLCVY